MPRRKLDIEPLDCEPIALTELASVMKEVLESPLPESQHSENREPTQEERNQKFTLRRRT